MSVLQALDGYYHRLAARGEVAEPGWSPEKFGWCVVINAAGEPVDVYDLHDVSGKKPKPKLYMVPASIKRTVGIAANFLWDKTAYALGRTAGEGKRTSQEHAAFIALHQQRLAGQDDEGLLALLRFLENWRPDRFDEAPFKPDMLDANILFRLEGQRGFIHERPAARALVEGRNKQAGGGGITCLITGEKASVARLHPTIKGVEGAQMAGASLVSFNLDAFTSLGKTQGDNAPTSEAAAFRYGTALNHMLTRDGPNRVRRPIGDTTVVFWADASQAEVADAAESLFGDIFDPPQDADEAYLVGQELAAIAKGSVLTETRATLAKGTRFHVLGLSPNAARLSVRFWLSDDFAVFAENLAVHFDDLQIEPRPLGWAGAPSVNLLLARTTALQGDYKNIPPLLAGEVMRAVLTGARYPQSLLAAAIIRLRAGDPKMSDGKSGGIGWHAAVIRAVLMRDHRLKFYKEKVPMSLDRDHRTPGYLLGRLFAMHEVAQRAALGRVNASIRDRYFGAASATPASVFPLIVRGGQNHLAKVRKEKPGWATLIERELDGIYSNLGATLPRSLSLQQQGEFAIGYYHQRSAKLKSDKGEEISLADHDASAGEEGDEA